MTRADLANSAALRKGIAASLFAAMWLLPAGVLGSESIRACVHPAPGFYVRDAAGAQSGLEFDLITGFAAATKRTVAFTQAPSFDQLLKDTEAGACDIGASTITVSEERRTRFLFSIPYFPNRIVVVQKSVTGLARQEDLKERRVAVVTGTISERLVSSINGAKPVLVKGDDAAFEALLKGEVDALACDSAVVIHYLAQNPELAIAFPIGERSFFAFALPKDSKLVEPLNQHLRKLIKSGEFEKVLAKHFGAEVAEVLAADVTEGSR